MRGTSPFTHQSTSVHQIDDWRSLHRQSVADTCVQKSQKGMPDYEYPEARSSHGIFEAVLDFGSYSPPLIPRLASRLVLTAFVTAACKPTSTRIFIPFSVLPPGTHTFPIMLLNDISG
jgi:hypothetical protein